MPPEKARHIELHNGDALIIVDLQNDFLPGGKLGVENGDVVITPLNHYIESFHLKGLPIYATRDWHPQKHCSFKEQGGIWPPHCIADTPGAGFSENLQLTPETAVISKATTVEKDAYSGFEGTDLGQQLRNGGIKPLFIGGLATDYCVLNTVKDALQLNFNVFLLQDAVRAVNVRPDDGDKALQEMKHLGAIPITHNMLS
jgi:nicotinamidase/pyrazinamidase